MIRIRNAADLPLDRICTILRAMKLRLDLLEQLTAEGILEEAAANQHRYKAEPSFSKTGIGYLSPATIEERAQEEARSEALVQKLKKRLQQGWDKGS
jgi:hypothetical protein